VDGIVIAFVALQAVAFAECRPADRSPMPAQVAGG
jgi:hypothetical protein